MRKLGTPITDWLEKHGDPEIEKLVDKQAAEMLITCIRCKGTGINVDFDRRDVSVCNVCKGEKKITGALYMALDQIKPPVVLKENLDFKKYYRP